MWQECGFCSPESSADLVRHVYFHCYHTKLKQWGLRALQSQSDVSHCQLDFQSRNIIPEIQENFLCLWEYCEVRTGDPVLLFCVLSVVWRPREGELLLSCSSPACLPLGCVSTCVKAYIVLWLRPACADLFTLFCLSLLPNRDHLIILSGSIGTWRITASVRSTKQQGRRTMSSSVAGKVSGCMQGLCRELCTGLDCKRCTGERCSPWQSFREPPELQKYVCMVLTVKYSCRISFRGSS